MARLIPRYGFPVHLAQWYKEGLIDPNIANVDAKTLDANILNDKTGATFGFAGGGLGKWMQALQEKNPNAELVPAPHVAGAKGEIPKIGQRDFPYTSAGSAAITSSCKNVELAARFLDYGYSEAGNTLYNFGIEGESFNMVDGYPTYTDKLMKTRRAFPWVRPWASISAATRTVPLCRPRSILNSITTRRSRRLRWMWAKTDMEKYMRPKITFTPEESSEVSTIMNNINTYVDEKTVRFIMGLEDLAAFDDYLSNLNGFLALTGRWRSTRLPMSVIYEAVTKNETQKYNHVPDGQSVKR